MFNFISLLKSLYKSYKIKFELRKYTDFTIAEYFRKQGAQIGENCRLMIRSLGPEPYLIKIGNHVSISNGVRLLTHDGSGWVFHHEDPTLQRFGKIEIKDNCFLGVNCIILPGITIGPNSIVGAGAVVTKDVPPNTIVAGNPARVIKSIDKYKSKIFDIWKVQKPSNYMSEFDLSLNSPENIFYYKNLSSNKIKLKNHLIKLFYS